MNSNYSINFQETPIVGLLEDSNIPQELERVEVQTRTSNRKHKLPYWLRDFQQ